MKLAVIARSLNMPISSLFERMKLLQSGLDLRYFSLLDYPKIGYPIRVFVAMHSDEPRDEFRSSLMQNLSVNTLSRVSGEYNYLAEAMFADVAGLEDFLEKLAKLGIRRKQVYYVIEACKQEYFLSSEEHLNLIA